MGHSVLEIPRAVRRRLKRSAQTPSEHGQRAHAILLLWETGNCVARVTRGLCAARSSVQRWRALFEEYGEQGLRSLERGRSEIPTPGQNKKRYLAGALNARTGKVVWAEHERKDSLLFIHLLYRLKRIYRRARRVVLIVDNYIIHKSFITRRWLANNPKFELLFQPVYHPWVNVIERLWKTLHDTVTRNHRHPSMKSLMGSVRRFMQACQPWPALAKA